MIMYIENSKDITRKLLELSNSVGYKINIQKLVVLLYTNNKLSEKLRKQSYA